ncbi:hypothetical protein BDC45DRAFT_519216 [Circinella umbellata]|nr:hypothetical protein BDC45DRAFT_519216 [Circinella umbellata]
MLNCLHRKQRVFHLLMDINIIIHILIITLVITTILIIIPIPLITNIIILTIIINNPVLLITILISNNFLERHLQPLLLHHLHLSSVVHLKDL